MGLIPSMIESRHNNRPIYSYITVCTNLADITRRNITNLVPFRFVQPFQDDGRLYEAITKQFEKLYLFITRYLLLLTIEFGQTNSFYLREKLGKRTEQTCPY